MKKYLFIICNLCFLNCSPSNFFKDNGVSRSNTASIEIQKLRSKKKVLLNNNQIDELFLLSRNCEKRKIFIIVPTFEITVIGFKGQQVSFYAGPNWFGPKKGSSETAVRYFLKEDQAVDVFVNSLF